MAYGFKKSTIREIYKQISQLQKKAKELESDNRPGLKKVVSIMKQNNITLNELGNFLGSKKGRKVTRASRRKVPVKYKDKNGNKWTGRGITPKWIREAEAVGHRREEFLVTENK